MRHVLTVISLSLPASPASADGERRQPVTDLAQGSRRIEVPYSICERIAARADVTETTGKPGRPDDKEVVHLCGQAHSCTKSREEANRGAVPKEALASNVGMMRYLAKTCGKD